VRILAVLYVSVSAGAMLCADLNTIKAEPNLEKRAAKALSNAHAAFESALDAYLAKADMKETAAALDELTASVELAYTSLRETRKNPSSRPKHFKRAEIQTRELLRRLGDFREQMAVDDREAADNARDALQKIHEDLLEGIMGGKKQK
jgi:hypothetical protein